MILFPIVAPSAQGSSPVRTLAQAGEAVSAQAPDNKTLARLVASYRKDSFLSSNEEHLIKKRRVLRTLREKLKATDEDDAGVNSSLCLGEMQS